MENLLAELERLGIEYQVDGNEITSGGSLYLRSLTSLPEGVTLSAGGVVYVPLLQSWRGHAVATYDGVSCLVSESARTVEGDVDVRSARYFRACDFEDMPRCFVAVAGELSAHGDTVREAIEDLRFKQIGHADIDDVVAAIRERGSITPAEYRVITGACRSGLREGMRAVGLDPETTEAVPLADVVRLSAGQYGGDRIAELFANQR